MSQQIKRYFVIGSSFEMVEEKDGDVCEWEDVALYIKDENFNSTQQLKAEISEVVQILKDEGFDCKFEIIDKVIIPKLQKLTDVQ